MEADSLTAADHSTIRLFHHSMFTTFGANRVDLELKVEKAIVRIGIDAVVSYTEYYDQREGRYVGKILYRDFEGTRL